MVAVVARGGSENVVIMEVMIVEGALVGMTMMPRAVDDDEEVRGNKKEGDGKI